MEAKKRKQYLHSSTKLAIGGLLGYYFFWLTSNPTKSPLRRKMPEKQFKNLSYLPEIRVRHKDKEYHLHHWMNLSLLYIVLLFIRKGYFKSYMLQAFLLGSILQGLTYHDRFQVIHRIEPPAVDEK